MATDKALSELTVERLSRMYRVKPAEIEAELKAERDRRDARQWSPFTAQHASDPWRQFDGN